jgi:AcrR family transcriptional regulator
VRTDGEVGGAPTAPEANAVNTGNAASRAHGADGADEPDEEQWPFFRYPREYPRSGRAARQEAREERIAGHVQRHKARGAQPPRRDRGLSRAEIVSAAIAVADAEGPDAISMRRIAREVGAGAMSLYWYVASKEELLDLMLDAIEAEIEVPEPTGDWRADLGAFAHRTRAALRQHRWAVEFIGTRPPSGPNDVRNLERLLSLLDGIGVDDYQLIMGIFMTVATFVIGAVIREAQEVRFQAEQERVEASMTAEEIQAEHERFRGWFERAGRYPHIARLMEAGIDPDDPNTREERFQFSLDCVLDGIAARIALAAHEPSG